MVIPSKDKVYALDKQEELVKQSEASESAQIAVTKAKQEEIDRIAVERSYLSKQVGIKRTSKMLKAANLAKIESYSLTTEEVDRLYKFEKMVFNGIIFLVIKSQL